MFKRTLTLGLTAGLLAGAASLVYQKVYAGSLGYDFADIATLPGIAAASVLGGLLAAVLYFLLTRWLGGRGEVLFNFVLMILTFASIVAPFAIKLPLEAEAPELFPGLIVPMHFFPALAWFTLKPLFLKPIQPIPTSA
ncbi:MAG TPA: hypothetical protein VHK91_01340 [Flavisolibacter sp.]|jgi:hypothetical protein|nr:hypothetical protein [Flavisolibacter sp.]